MAYGLKYYHHFGPDNDPLGGYRIDIYEKDYSGIYRQIGDIAGLNVGYEGGDNDYYAPIIKSSLTLSLVDSRDKTQTPLVQNSFKYGAWEEFFTSDATKYKVTLSYNGTTFWTGYVTPDSWEEDLVYRGIVTITARDNIGHLQDFDFDYESTNGLIGLESLLDAAMDVIGQSYVIEERTAEIYYWYNDSDSSQNLIDIGAVMFDVQAFEGKTWYEALEGALESLGLCIRMMSHVTGEFVVSAIRYLSDIYIEDEEHRNEVSAQFVNSSGHRVLSPAFKSITDKFKYKAKEYEAEKPTGYVWKSAVPFEAYILDGPNWKTTTPESLIRTLNPSAMSVYGGRKEWRTPDTLMIRATKTTSNDYFSRKFTLPSDCGVTVSFGVNPGFFTTLYDSQSGEYSIGWMNNNITMRVLAKWISYDGSNDQYLTSGGNWVAAQTFITKSITGQQSGYGSVVEENVTFTTPSSPGYLELRFYAVTSNAGSEAQANVEYARISGLTFEIDDQKLVKEDSVTTIYDLLQNQMLTREPMFGQYPQQIYAGSVINALYADEPTLGYPSIQGWSFGATEEPEFASISVMVHKELLLIHGAPMSLLSGELMDATYGHPCLDDRWNYGDKKLILVGGTLDVITERVEGSFLREYLDWEDVWDE